MKKTTGFILAIFLIIVAAVVILATFDFNRFNKDNLYVQIDELVEVEETVLDSGAKLYSVTDMCCLRLKKEMRQPLNFPLQMNCGPMPISCCM